jgi:predicted RNA-binding Zn-ribbon protein involved in translation (DUF1610 family)
MAETRYYDCPECGRENVVGYRKLEDGDKVAKTVGAGGLAAAGALAAGPLGALAGFAIGKWLGDKAVESGKELKFSFRCPRCGHEFTRWFKN